MKIAIDAKWYFTGPVSTRVVLRNVLPLLFDRYPDHEWIVFLDRNDRDKSFPIRGPNILIEYVWAENNMLSNVFVLNSRLRRIRPDVVLFQTFPAFRQTFPAVAFIHDVLFRGFPQFFTLAERTYFLPLAWLTKHRAHRLIATTEFVAGELLKYDYVRDRDRIDIVPLGVSQSFRPAGRHDPAVLDQVRLKFRLPASYLLFVGRLNVRKNIQGILQALPRIQNKEIPLVIVGEEDWRRPALKELLSDPSIRRRVLFTGSMNDDELQATYAMATVFCFPSFAEGFGLPPLEAMAAGIPVIVSGTTSLPEVCAEAAVYIDPESPESIAKAVDELLNDPALYQRKRILGLERAGRLTWAKTAEALMQSIIHTKNQVPL